MVDGGGEVGIAGDGLGGGGGAVLGGGGGGGSGVEAGGERRRMVVGVGHRFGFGFFFRDWVRVFGRLEELYDGVLRKS